MNPNEAHEAAVVQILDEAAQQVAALLSKRFNETCPCPADHEVAISTWTFAYEHVDMRPGGAPFAGLEVVHSTHSLSHAAGILSTASNLLQTKEISAHFDGPGAS